MDFPLAQFSAAAGGWSLTGLFVLAMFTGHIITRRSHEREMALVTKRAELAEERAGKAEAQRDQLLMPLAAIADRTFTSLQPNGDRHVPASRQGTETPASQERSAGSARRRGSRTGIGRQGNRET